MFLALSVTIAMFFAWRSRHERGRHDWLCFWLAMAASFLFKGPIGLAIVVPVLLVYPRWARDGRSWRLRPLLGVPLFVLLGLPWYIAVCMQHDGLLDYFLLFQTAERMLTKVHGRAGPPWFYIPVLLGGFFPWSTALPRVMLKAYHRAEPFDRFLLLWIVLPVIFFSCAGSKLPTYLLPIFPALAMLTARSTRSPGEARTVGTTALVSMALFGLALALYLSHGAAPEIAPGAPYLTALAALLGLGCAAALALRSRLDEVGWMAWPGALFALGILALASALGPCDKAYSARVLAQSIRALEPPHRDIVEVADHVHGLPYYLDRRIVQVAYPRETQFDPPQDYRDYLFPDLASYYRAEKPAQPPLIILRRSDYEAFADPQWPQERIGTWYLVRPGTPPETDLPSAGAQTATARAVDRHPGLQ
jgi:4-amino-4-deoxy-L-arabinose transferase-like glycosyltransferase